MRRFHHHRRYRRHHHHIRVVLVINGMFAVELPRNEVIHMAYTLDVGKTENFSIEFLDQDGKAMERTPTPDSPPAWADSNTAAQTLTAAPDGLTASAVGVAAGSGTVQVQLLVAGSQFTATMDYTINAVQPSQTLTSIGIVATPAP
jgi:hypothetical protein